MAFRADDAVVYDQQAFEKRIVKPDDAVDLLQELCDELANTDPFDAANLEATVKRFVEHKQIKIGQIIHALRVAVTGKAVGFGMFETLAILGRQRCLARVDRALSRLSGEEAAG